MYLIIQLVVAVLIVLDLGREDLGFGVELGLVGLELGGFGVVAVGVGLEGEEGLVEVGVGCAQVLEVGCGGLALGLELLAVA